MILNVGEFLEKFDVQACPPIILVGPGKAGFNKEPFEPFLADRAIEKILEAHVDPTLQDLMFSSFYAEETAPGVVAEMVQTFPFLAEKRVVLVRNADVYMGMPSSKRSPLQPLLQFIENPNNSALLILISPEANRQRVLFKSIEKNGLIVECPQLEDKAYAAWIRGEVARHGKQISPDALSLIIDRVGTRMSEMHNAIHLVCNYVGTATSIEEKDILAACADVAETSIWTLTDAIAASDSTKALEALHELIQINKSPDEIIGILNWLLESAYRAHPDTTVKLGKPFVEKKVAPLTRKFSPSRLAAALAMCNKTHFAIRSTGSDPQLLLELMIIKLAVAKR